MVSGSSALTLAEPGKAKHRRKGTSPSGSMANIFASGGSLIKHASTFDLSKNLMTNMYFSDINPRNMRRLMNIVAVTGMFQFDNVGIINCHAVFCLLGRCV